MAEVIDVLFNARSNFSAITGDIKNLQSQFQSLTLPKGISDNLEKSFNKLTPLVKEYQKQLEKGFSNKKDLQNFEALKGKITDIISEIKTETKGLNGQEIRLKTDVKDIQNLEKTLVNLKEKLNIKTKQIFPDSKGLDKITSEIERFKNISSNMVTKGGFKTPAISRMATELSNALKAEDFSGYIAKVKELEQHLLGLGKSTRLNFAHQLGLDETVTSITKADAKIQSFFKSIILSSTKANGIDELRNDIVTLEQAIEQTKMDSIAKGAAGLSNVDNLINNITSDMNRMHSSTQDAAGSMVRMVDQVNDLKTSTQYFFSLRNMINLLKRGIDQAVQSVKDLDKAMTETAVVTDFNVSDMWGKLPEYTELANELGATTQGAYETMTLYYQQGLDTNQAFEIGAETMKMARIAGLEYKDATDMMTAALRGFNMELDETSAKNVNDVYSKLAAITASDTAEIGEAMERTASIAHSAGMSFEGTSAFLAQMIETTREAPENLGTAMKTIVARFQEMKENPLEITEVDGEEVSYNKIDKALKTIGVDLKDTNGQFRELDQVFLDIAQRWDGLSQVQQRYIATTAAGSRQQSRFIAMMNNYDRTMQLMEAANDSAGASDEQFGKTMESLEAKLNKLHNAWQEFTMGIANSGMIKTAVDGLTGFLNITNRVIDALSLGSGTIKSFLSVFAAFTGLKAGGKVLNSLIGGLGGLVDPTSSFGAGFSRGMTGNRQAVNAAQAAAIYQPIVSAINNQTAALGGEINEGNLQRREGAYDKYNSFKDANQNVRGLTQGSYNSRDLINELSKYDRATQRNIMRGLAGTELATTQSLMKRYSGGGKEALKGISQTKTQLRAMRNMGQLSDAEYFRTLYDPRELLKYIDNSNAIGQAAEAYLNKLSSTIKDKSNNILEDMYQNYEQEVRNSMEGELEEDILDTLQTRDEFKNDEKNRQQAERQATHEILDDETRSNTGIIKTLDNIGKVGAGVSQFGMAIQGFSSLLMNSANPAIQTFGSLLNSLGSGIASLGMGISGVSSAFSAVAGSNLISSLTAEGGMLASLGISATAATGGLFALAAAIAAVVGIVTVTRKNIKEEAQKLTDTYKERSEKNQTNIANLQQWREELATLSKGVDENGLNINLDPSDYARYQEIIDGIAEISPELVQGYNLQGHAIVNNNQALEQSLSLEKQRAKEIADNYTNTEAWVKLLDARNLQKVSTRTPTKEQDSLGMTQVQPGFELKPRKEMQTQMAKIGQELKKNRDLIDLSGLNVDIDALARGEEQAFNQVLNNLSAFRSRVNNAIENAGDDWSEHSSSAITKAFSSFSDASAELEELIQPMYESLSVYASETGAFDNMADNLKGSFQKALKDLAQDANIDGPAEMREAVDNVIDQFSRMGSEYNDIMAEVNIARKNFADNFNETEYQAQIEEPIQQLEKLKKAFEGTPGESALTQWIDNEIDKIQNHISSGSATIEGAWDTLSGKVTEAEGAYESFSKQTEKDYSTAADGMKQIREAVVAETDDIATHMEGFGDKTYWKGAENLFGDLRGKSKKEVDGMFKEAEGLLETGQKGVDNFYDKVVAAYNNGAFKDITEGLSFGEDGFFSNIDEEVNPEVFKQVADALGMSEQFLTSMLNKSQQFMNMDFTNYGDLREALGNDSNTLKGHTSLTYGADEDNNGERDHTGQALYMTQEEFKELMGHKYYDDTERKNKEEELETQAGIKVLKEADKFRKSDLKDLGINSLKDAVNTLGHKYDEADLKTIAEKVERANAKAEAKEKGEEFDEEAFQKQFDEDWQNYYPEYLKEQDYPTLQPLQSIESLVAQIAGVVAKGEIEKGGLNEELKQSDDIKDKVFGGEGVDTLAQHFFRGQDANGNDLTETSYSAGKRELEGLKTEVENYRQALKEGLTSKELSEDQRELYKNELNKTDGLISAITSAITKGTEIYESKNKPETTNTDTTTTDRLNDKYGTGKTGGKLDYEDRPLTTEAYETASAEQSKQIQTDIANKTAEGIKGFFSHLFTSNWQEPREKKTSTDTADTSSEQSASELSSAAAGLEGATTAVQEFTGAATSLTSAGEQLSAAASNLNSAAAVIVANNNPNNGPAQPSTTVPGVPAVATNESSVSGTITVDNSGALANLDAVYKKATETTEAINQGATYTIKVPGLTNLNKAATAAKKVSDSAGEKTISVSAGAVDTKNVETALTQINKSKANIQVGAKTKDAYDKAKAAKNTIDSYSATIDVSANFSGSWTHDVDININKHYTSTGVLYRAKGGIAEYPAYPKKGTDRIPAYLTPGEYVQNRKAVQYFGIDFMRKINHKDLVGALQSFGSAAKGRYGTIGPKNKGGLTLTGEKGFEIVWLPDESRSMILGANGPQMISLPSNAVVYTHEQSQKILKQKSIPAGSHSSPGKTTVRVDTSSYRRSRSGSNNNNNNNNNTYRASQRRSSGGSNKTAKRNEENSKKTKKIIEKAGKINAWWWNMTKKVEATQRKIDKGAKKVSEILKKVGKTISVVKETVNDYAKNLRTQIQLNTRMSNKANKKLETLDTAKKSSATKKAETAVSKAQKKLNKAKNKKDKKEAKKQLTKAKNKLRKTQKGVNYSTISYDVTQVEKDKKGKKKKSKKTKKQRINLAPFIKYDEETGAYVIDYNKINKKYGKNKSKAKAVMEAAEKKLEDYQGKKNTAEDNIEKANEALNQLGQDLYDAIYGWEVELTKIWNITQQIEETTGHIERLTSFIDLMDAQVASGMAEVNADFIKEYTDTFRNKLKADIQKLEQQMQLIDFGKIELQDLLDVNTNADAISNIGAINKATEDQIEQVNETKNKYESKKDTAAAKKATKEAAYKELQDAKAKLDKLKNAKKKDKKAIAAAQKEVEKKRAAYNKTKDPYTTAAKEKEEAEKNYNTATETWKEGIEAGTLFDDYDYALNSKYVEELKADQMARQLAQGLTKITTNDDGTVSVDFNADEFLRARKNGKFDDGTVLNGETANRIQEYVKSIVDKVNELNNAYVEATNLIAEQYQQLAELKDNWANYGEQLLSYVEEQQSEKIDELKALADSIDKSLKDLLDKVRQDLDRRRQQEDNAKTERNISKKQQRLATLRSNTGGGNQVEIARLQEEIAEEQMNYQRTLEDQLLERLNDQADLAAKQRERQIQLEEAILQATNNAALVNKWMDDPERYKDEIQAAFYDNNKYNELTAAQQAKLEDEFNELYKGLLTNPKERVATEKAIRETEILIDDIKDSLAKYSSELKSQEPEKTVNDGGDDNGGDDGEEIDTDAIQQKYNQLLIDRGSSKSTHVHKGKIGSEALEIQINRAKSLGISETRALQDLANTDELTWTDVLKAYIKVKGKKDAAQIIKEYFGDNPSEQRKKGWKEAFGKTYPKYYSGGLADYTGPAWLDGTPAKPELVLSSTDTKNFIALKDVLSHVMGSTNSLSNVYGGDASYEININVDHINSDYDVDKIAARIEKKIVSSANYRNVTQVRKFR